MKRGASWRELTHLKGEFQDKLSQACTLGNCCRLFALLLVAWQPFPGEYRIPLVGSALLGLTVCLRGGLAAVAASAKRLATLLLCLLIPGLISIPTSLAPSKSWAEIASVAMVGLAGISVLYGLRSKPDHQWLQNGLAAVVGFWIVDGLLQALTGADVFGVPLRGGMVTGPFTPVILLGIIVVVLTPLLLWEPLKQKNRAGFALLAGILIIATLSGQRNNLLLLAVAFTSLSFLWLKRTRLALAAAFAAALIIIYPFSPPLQSRLGNMINSGKEIPQLLLVLKQDPSNPKVNKQIFESLNEFSSNRWFIFDAALRMIADRPLTGVGLNAFRPAYPLYAQKIDDFRKKPPHAHNTYLEVTAETGLVGLAGLLFGIGLGWHWLANASRERQEIAAPYAASIAVMLFPLSTHHVLLAAFYFSIFLMVLCGFLSALFAPELDHNIITGTDCTE